MHPADIIAALTKAGHPATEVANDLEVDRSTVSLVIHSKGTSYNVASYISVVTGVPLNKLWPDGRYDKPSAAA